MKGWGVNERKIIDYRIKNINGQAVKVQVRKSKKKEEKM